MPPRNNPTARQTRLGAELRKMRERAGLTARDAAGLLGISPMQMSHLEVGRIGVSEERLRRLASLYSCPDPKLVDALAAMANDRGKGWWEEYRGILAPVFLDMAELEYKAASLRTVQIAQIPGILQTEDYIRAVFAYAVPELPPEELDARVAHRVHRRVLFDRDPATQFEAVIHEAALRIRVGSRKAAQDQLHFILELSERPNISVRIIPMDMDGFPGSTYSMLHAGGPMPQLDTVHLDAAHGSVFLDAEAQLAKYRAIFTKIEAASLDPMSSQDFIMRVVREL